MMRNAKTVQTIKQPAEEWRDGKCVRRYTIDVDAAAVARQEKIEKLSAALRAARDGKPGTPFDLAEAVLLLWEDRYGG